MTKQRVVNLEPSWGTTTEDVSNERFVLVFESPTVKARIKMSRQDIRYLAYELWEVLAKFKADQEATEAAMRGDHS